MSADAEGLESVYPGLQSEGVPAGLLRLLPRDKGDVERARLLVARGYPEVRPVVPHMMTWLQDYNWPVAKVFAPFLASLGPAVVEEARKVLRSDDDVWKYWVLSCVVGELPPEAARELAGELEDVAAREDEEGAHEVAREILDRTRAGGRA